MKAGDSLLCRRLETVSANQHHTDLGIGTGLRPLTMFDRFGTNAVQDGIPDPYSNHLDPRFSKTNSAKDAVVPVLSKNRVLCRSMTWRARLVPFAPRTSSNAGLMLRASAGGLLALVLKGLSSAQFSIDEGPFAGYRPEVVLMSGR
jgi:hypothetical protein